MGLDAKSRAAVEKMPENAKLVMLQQHLQKQGANAKGTPDFYARALKDYRQKGISSTAQASKTLNAIRVSLNNQPIAWVKKFISMDGVDHLLELLNRLTGRE